MIIIKSYFHKGIDSFCIYDVWMRHNCSQQADKAEFLMRCFVVTQDSQIITISTSNMQNNKKKVEKQLEVFRMLENEIELSSEYNAHKLIGNYKGCLECHVEGDFLLIWIDENAGIIEAVRLGSHSELFE